MKFFELVRLANALCGRLVRKGYPVTLFNRTTRSVVLDCSNVCCREEKLKLWECLKTNRVVISKTPRAGDVTVISRSSWIGPPLRFIKMNTDGAFSHWNGESGGGVVFRGCSAHVLKALSIRFGRLCSPQSAEFEALRIGLTEAIKLGYLTPILEMDCLPIVQAIQGKRPLLDEERKAVSSLPFHCLKDYSMVMTPREANSLADILARTGLSGSTKTERDRALYSTHLVEQEDALRETRFRLRWPETVANERDVQQPPVARTLVLAGKAQKEEMGDGVNSTVTFAGELYRNAQELIRNGLYPCEVIIGYTKAINKTIEILDELVEQGVRIKEEVIVRMKATVASKQFGQEDILCSLIADACIHVCPKNPANFNVDNVRVAKLLGGGLHDCTVVRGMVLKTDAVGCIQRVEKAKVVVFSGGVDTSATETKGTMQIHSAEQLEKYSKTEAAKVEELIKAVAESGAKVVVSEGAVGEMALHFCERYKLMVLKISSKFELQRFCRTTGAVAILKLGRPNPNDLGYVDSVSVEEIGGVGVTVVKNEEGGNSVSTVVLRGSTDSILDDLERAVDDGVNTYKAMCRESCMVPGAAATGVELTRKLKEFSFNETALYQFAIDKFAESFENAGPNAMEIISSLYAEHASGNSKLRVDLEEGICEDVSDMNIRDLHDTKFFALIHAADAACTALRVDQ